MSQGNERLALHTEPEILDTRTSVVSQGLVSVVTSLESSFGRDLFPVVEAPALTVIETLKSDLAAGIAPVASAVVHAELTEIDRIREAVDEAHGLPKAA